MKVESGKIHAWKEVFGETDAVLHHVLCKNKFIDGNVVSVGNDPI